MKSSKNLENKTLWDTYWRVQLVCMNVQAHSSLEPPLEYNQDQTPLMNQVCCVFLTILGVIEICSFRLVLERKTGKEIPEPSKIRVISKNFNEQFCFIKCRRQYLWALEKRWYCRYLCWEHFYVAICQKPHKPSFWEVIDSFVLRA